MTTCSVMTLRRYEAGELPAPEKAALEAHLPGCERCAALRRELAEERERLARDVPFDVFASGVAEKLARQAHPVRQKLIRAIAPLAVAASIAVVATMGLRGGASDDGVRSKGGTSIELFVQDPRGIHAVGKDEKIAEGAHLLPALHGVSGRRMVVTLVELEESTVLYDGPAQDGALPQAFEWTGHGAATLRVAVDGRDVAEATLRR